MESKKKLSGDKASFFILLKSHNHSHMISKYVFFILKSNTVLRLYVFSIGIITSQHKNKDRLNRLYFYVINSFFKCNCRYLHEISCVNLAIF